MRVAQMELFWMTCSHADENNIETLPPAIGFLGRLISMWAVPATTSGECGGAADNFVYSLDGIASSDLTNNARLGSLPKEFSGCSALKFV